MRKRYLFSIAILISLLIILIPIAVATEIDAYNNLVLKTKEQKIYLYQSFGRNYFDEVPAGRDYSSNPGEACVAQQQKTSTFADVLDNSVISTLEKIVSILFVITTTMSAIDMVISSISLIIGMISGGCCYRLDPFSCPAAEGKFRTWSAVYAFVQPLACFVNCGWCTGAEGCFGVFGIDLKSISLLDIPNLGFAGPGEGVAQFKISPYDSIYTAIGCLCPIAILFNLRKLKAIYEVYDCCIQKACENGLSTEPCEKQLDEATCIYWEGSLYSIIAKILMAILANVVTKVVTNLIKEEKLLACVFAVLKLVEVPKALRLASSAWSYMKEFDTTCEDLDFGEIREASDEAMEEAAEKGFEDIKEGLLEDWERITLIDKDDDGIYDYSIKWEDAEGVGETWIRSWDYTKGKYVEKLYIKQTDGTITDFETGKEVSWWKWYKIKSKNVIKKDKTPDEIKFNKVYWMTWELLDMTLGEKIDNKIRDRCKDDSEKSYPQSDEPIDSGGEETLCEGIDYNIYNAQFISKTQLNSTCKYEVSYSIKNCGSAIEYIVQLAGTTNEELIEQGHLDFGQIISRKRRLDSGLCTHNRICITASDGHDQCYPS